MTAHTAKLPRFFYRMPPRPCPYLKGRTEQNIFTELTGPNTAGLYDALTLSGFRRSHNVAYRPACPGCRACVPVRVVAPSFAPGASLRRIVRRNADLVDQDLPARATAEQYELFLRYVTRRDGRYGLRRLCRNGAGQSVAHFRDRISQPEGPLARWSTVCGRGLQLFRSGPRSAQSRHVIVRLIVDRAGSGRRSVRGLQLF